MSRGFARIGKAATAFIARIVSAFRTDSSVLTIELCKYKYTSGECVRIPLEKIEFQTWLHFCLVYTQKRLGSIYKTKAKAYFNGDLTETSELRISHRLTSYSIV